MLICKLYAYTKKCTLHFSSQILSILEFHKYDALNVVQANIKETYILFLASAFFLKNTRPTRVKGKDHEPLNWTTVSRLSQMNDC